MTQTQGVTSTGQGNRPNRICDGRLDNPTIDRWFEASTSCFVPPADTTGTYGNSGGGILRGPGQFNIDMSILFSGGIDSPVHGVSLFEDLLERHQRHVARLAATSATTMARDEVLFTAASLLRWDSRFSSG